MLTFSLFFFLNLMRSYDAKYIFFSAGGGLRMCVCGGGGGGGGRG